MPLQHKLLFGYIILVAVIASMVAILVHELRRSMSIRNQRSAKPIAIRTGRFVI